MQTKRWIFEKGNDAFYEDQHKMELKKRILEQRIEPINTSTPEIHHPESDNTPLKN